MRFAGSYAKDFSPHVLRAFDPDLVTIVAMDPPGYGKSRPPDRKQEINRCMKDAPFVIKLMQVVLIDVGKNYRGDTIFSVPQPDSVYRRRLE